MSLCLATLSLGEANAQYKISAKAPNLSALAPIKELRASYVSAQDLVLDELNADEFRSTKLNDKSSEFRVYRFAINRPLNLDLQKLGQWSLDNEGHYVWTFSITSPKALSGSLLFEDYELKDDAKLFVYGQKINNKALSSLNNTPSKVLQLAPIKGETIKLIYVASEGDKSKTLPFRITRFSHGFRDIQDLAFREQYGFSKGEPYYDYQGALSGLFCADNVIKHEAQDLQARSVVLLVTDGDTMSTASLINNARHDGTPYLLTASHCVNRVFSYPNDLERVKKTAQTTVVFFGFQSPIPNGNIRGSEEKTISGAELIAYNTGTDMALLKLTGLPSNALGKKFIPPAYNPYFSGWNINPNPKGKFFNIHHPWASTKRFNLSKEKDISLLSTYKVNGLIFKNTHWLVKKWSIGTTAGGSSGSPLFDKKGRIIGGLTGGVSSCYDPKNDKFFALYKTWEGSTAMQSLKPWLDPDNTSAKACAGFDPNETNQVYRLSEFYAKEQSLEIYNEAHNGLARFLEIEGDGEMEVLGSYFVFKGNKELQLNFPKHLLELRPIEGKEVGEVLWSSEVTMPTYEYYSQSSSAFVPNPRTILKDTIEVFQPKAGVKIQAGKYLLCLRRAEAGQPITLPLLKSNKGARANSLTYYSQGAGQWNETRKGAVWLDLVLQSARPITLGGKVQLVNTPLCYYSKGKLYAYINKIGTNDREMSKLRIYDLEGKLCYQTESLTLGQNIFDLGALARHKVYIAVLSVDGEQRSIKFIHQ